jgi:hypothetical protein
VSKGMPIASWSPPDGLEVATVDAFSGLRPGPFSSKQVRELFIKGTVPRDADNIHHGVEIDAATGMLWQDGCAGPRKVVGALDFSHVEENFPNWGKYTRGWVKRASRGPGVSGGPEGTRTAYFYGGKYLPYGNTWGGIFAPTELCTIPEPTPPPCGLFFQEPCPTDTPRNSGPPHKTPKP